MVEYNEQTPEEEEAEYERNRREWVQREVRETQQLLERLETKVLIANGAGLLATIQFLGGVPGDNGFSDNGIATLLLFAVGLSASGLMIVLELLRREVVIVSFAIQTNAYDHVPEWITKALFLPANPLATSVKYRERVGLWFKAVGHARGVCMIASRLCFGVGLWVGIIAIMNS